MISSVVRKHMKRSVKGENIPRAGIPESFNVLVHELRGLGLDLKFHD
jgi:DNA-directed RNA polymerase subunit beta